MDKKKLKDYIDKLTSSLDSQNITLLSARLNGLVPVFPFNEYEYKLMFLLDKKILDFEDYEKFRDLYISSNKYLGLFGLSPRVFGEIWAQKHIQDLDTHFIKPNKTIDPSYLGEYDLWEASQRIKIEIKACRAINTKNREDLISKALQYGTNDPFWMNYQQLKLDAAQVFIFIGVWVNTIKYYILSSKEAKDNPYLSHQHRGGIEYQIGITHNNLEDFKRYEISSVKLWQEVIKKARNK